MKEIDQRSQALKNKILNAEDKCVIRGTVYYVSNDGDDTRDGRTPETAWKTLERVSGADLQRGDGVLFRRGDLFRGFIETRAGVTYAAYGAGEKPRLYGWDYNLGKPELWELYDKEHHIWKLKEKILDCGTLVFNDGEAHSRKLIPSYIGGRFVCREDESRPFEMEREMTEDLDLFCDCTEVMTDHPGFDGKTFPVPHFKEDHFGTLYLRCDKGNPATVYSDIEALPRRNMFNVRQNDHVTIDNLCLKYIGAHAVSASQHSVGLTVTNCEIGWIGGVIQNYVSNDPNFPEGHRGQVTRFGNGVEVYGGCEHYTVSNCYFYEIYDAAITHQRETRGVFTKMAHIRYTDNLIERTVYPIEYFLFKSGGDTESYMEDVEIRGNIIRETGYGWGQQRHNKDMAAAIKGQFYDNTARNFRICDNIFDRSAYRLLQTTADTKESCPVFENNVYIQKKGGLLGQFGALSAQPPMIPYDKETAPHHIKDESGTFYEAE
ncbi:MAG: hypothetical protein IKM48_05605 [Clostridia bacterium]|nr:hypothetical protein [Clostridia bacterium]